MPNPTKTPPGANRRGMRVSKYQHSPPPRCQPGCAVGKPILIFSLRNQWVVCGGCTNIQKIPPRANRRCALECTKAQNTPPRCQPEGYPRVSPIPRKHKSPRIQRVGETSVPKNPKVFPPSTGELQRGAQGPKKDPPLRVHPEVCGEVAFGSIPASSSLCIFIPISFLVTPIHLSPCIHELRLLLHHPRQVNTSGLIFGVYMCIY